MAIGFDIDRKVGLVEVFECLIEELFTPGEMPSHTRVDDGARGTLVVDLRISRTIVAPYVLEIIELTIKR